MTEMLQCQGMQVVLDAVMEGRFYSAIFSIATTCILALILMILLRR